MPGELTSEAVALVEAARAEAQRLRHGALRVEHGLAVLAQSTEGRELLVARRVNPFVLEGALEPRLRELPEDGAGEVYRSVRPPADSPEWKAAVARAGRIGWFGRAAVRLPALVDALLASDAARALLAECEVDAEPIERVYFAAVDVARTLRHANVLVTHAFYAVLDVPSLAPSWTRAVRAAGGDTRELRRRLRTVLGPQHSSVVLAPLGVLVQLAMEHMKASGRTDPRPSPDTMFVRWLRESPVRETLGAIGLEPYAALFALAHGQAPGAAEQDADGAPRAVVFHDDDHTTMEFVEEVLAGCFDLEPETAHAVMRRVHDTGETVVGSYAAEEARARVARAREAARAKMMPLRITTSRARVPVTP